jgi:hypothetical protein
MYSNTLYMSNIDVGSSLSYQFELAVSLNHDIITSFDSTSDPEPQNLSQVGWN